MPYHPPTLALIPILILLVESHHFHAVRCDTFSLPVAETKHLNIIINALNSNSGIGDNNKSSSILRTVEEFENKLNHFYHFYHLTYNQDMGSSEKVCRSSTKPLQTTTVSSF